MIRCQNEHQQMYYVMARFIILFLLKYKIKKPQMIQMVEDELAGVWKEVVVAWYILMSSS
jgi:hypothetical protein